MKKITNRANVEYVAEGLWRDDIKKFRAAR